MSKNCTASHFIPCQLILSHLTPPPSHTSGLPVCCYVFLPLTADVEYEREVEKKEISQAQAKAQKDESPFQYASHLSTGTAVSDFFIVRTE